MHMVVLDMMITVLIGFLTYLTIGWIWNVINVFRNSDTVKVKDLFDFPGEDLSFVIHVFFWPFLILGHTFQFLQWIGNITLKGKSK